MTLDWLQFVASGEPQIVTVARLPPDLCRIIGSDSSAVRLRHDYALKLHRKHRLSRQTVYRIKADPVETEALLAAWDARRRAA